MAAGEPSTEPSGCSGSTGLAASGSTRLTRASRPAERQRQPSPSGLGDQGRRARMEVPQRAGVPPQGRQVRRDPPAGGVQPIGEAVEGAQRLPPVRQREHRRQRREHAILMVPQAATPGSVALLMFQEPVDRAGEGRDVRRLRLAQACDPGGVVRGWRDAVAVAQSCGEIPKLFVRCHARICAVQPVCRRDPKPDRPFFGASGAGRAVAGVSQGPGSGARTMVRRRAILSRIGYDRYAEVVASAARRSALSTQGTLRG